jgi:hypothetical protein
LFDSESRIIADYAYLEENFGKLVPMELVIRVPKEMQSGVAVANSGAGNSFPLSLLERAEAVGRFDTAVRRTLGESGTGVVGRTMSAVTFLPPLPEPSTSYSPARKRFESRLTAAIESLPDTDYFRVEKNGPFTDSELWRISLRVGALSDVDYGQFVGDLRKTVTPVLDAYRARSMILAAFDSRSDGETGTGDSALADSDASISRRQPPRILLVGASEPKRMEAEDFLAIDANMDRDAAIGKAVLLGRQSELIRQDRLFVSALGELLSGERIKRPLWVDFDSEQTKIKPGTPQWDKLIEAVDLVVMVGDQTAIDSSQLAAAAKRFVDIRRSEMPLAEPMLIDSIPSESNAAPLQAVYTGIVPVVYKAQRTLLVSLIESIFLAFFLIAFVMIALLIPGRLPGVLLKPRVIGCGIVAGLIAMVPNLFPVVVIFGMMGHGNTLVDIGTMMTASVAMGVAVDDTIHFLTWFRENIDRGLNRVEAVIETYRRVGPAMTQTTIVGGLGLFVFALSTFTPTQRFGTLMLVLLAAALVGDLILLPALLAGPLGRWFRPRPPLAVEGPSEGPNESGNADSSASAKPLSQQTQVGHASRGAHPGFNGQAESGSRPVKEPATTEQAASQSPDISRKGPPAPKGTHQGNHVSRGT